MRSLLPFGIHTCSREYLSGAAALYHARCVARLCNAGTAVPPGGLQDPQQGVGVALLGHHPHWSICDRVHWYNLAS